LILRVFYSQNRRPSRIKSEGMLYQARFFDLFRKFSGRLPSADENPAILEGTWDRDKLVLMSFPDEAGFHGERIFRLSGNRLAARKCAHKITCAYSYHKNRHPLLRNRRC
jgi:hypothetical protein